MSSIYRCAALLITISFLIPSSLLAETSATTLLNQASLIQASLKAQGITTPPIFSRLLILGTKGEDVRNLQKLLNQDPATKVALLGPGSPGQETDFFGPATKAALTKFQLKYQIDPVGHAGPATRAKLTLIAQGYFATPVVASTPVVKTPTTTPKLKETAAEKKVRLAAEKAAKAAKLAADKAAKTAAEQALANVKTTTPTPSTQTTTQGTQTPSTPVVTTSGSGECFDNKDNDNDGQTDFTDFGCFGPNGQETSKNYGFTLFTLSSDTKIIYVSNSTGSDTNDGLSADKPVKTLLKGYNLLRTGSPDWLLLKRGDTWANENFNMWEKSGRSLNEHMVLGSYGQSTTRPRIMSAANMGFETGRTPVNYFTMDGIGFQGNSLPKSFAIRWLASAKDVLIENISITTYSNAITLQNFYGPVNNITVRRSLVFNNEGLGIYAEGINGVLLEENFIDHNGWSDASNPSDVFTHNVYITSATENLVFRNNITANASSHGIQARPGGIVEDNLFIDNPIGLSYGFLNGGSHYVTGGVSGYVKDNVFLGGRDIDGSPRGWAMELANIKANSGTAVSGNIIAQDTQNAYAAIQVSYGKGMTNPQESSGIADLTIKDNIIYKWAAALSLSAGLVPGGSGHQSVNGLKVLNNDFQAINNARIVDHANPYDSRYEIWSGNRYYNALSDAGWFSLAAIPKSFTNWVASVESTAKALKVVYKDPNRTINSYDKNFFKEVLKQSRFNWRSDYTAHAANEYIRDGFREVRTEAVTLTSSQTPATPPVSTPVSTPSTSTPSPSNPASQPVPQASGSGDAASGLVAYYSFDDGTGKDSAGSNDGTLAGAPGASTGKISQALDFTAAGQRVNLGSGSAFADIETKSGGGMTLAAWIYPRSSGPYGVGQIMNKNNVSTNSNGAWSFALSSNTLHFEKSYSGTLLAKSTANNTIALNQWQHVVMTWDGSSNASGVRLYVNGAQPSSVAISDGAGSKVSDAGNYFSINDGVGSRTFDGKIDEVKIYNRSLSASDVATLYNASLSKIQTTSNLASPTAAIQDLRIQFTGVLNQLYNLFR